ncbi:MAG: T9SS type A sorting domain-containing protein [Janthinobacterium lividum]
MRRYSLPALLTLLAAAAQAQTSPSITSADFPTTTDTLRLSQAAIVLPTGAPAYTLNGANKTWNYAGLVATAQRVEKYADVSTAAGALVQFTFNSILSGGNKANLLSPQNLPIPTGAGLPITDPYEFYNLSATSFKSVGFAGTLTGTAVPITYASTAQQDVIYNLPITYGNAVTVSNSLLTTPATLATTGYFSQKRQRTNTVDAWGTITTPFGTFQAVRVVTKLVDHDSIAFGGTAGQGLNLPVRREYKWLAKTIHVPVLTITTNEVAGQEVISSVEYRDIYRKIPRLLAARDAATDAVFSIYPNPSAAGSALRLNVPAGTGPFTLTATDVLGRLVARRIFGSSASGTVTLDADALGTFRGVLLLTVTTEQGTATRRVVRE